MADCKVIYSNAGNLEKRKDIMLENDQSSDLYNSCLDCGMLTLSDCYPSTPTSTNNSAASSPSSSCSGLQRQRSQSSSCSPEIINNNKDNCNDNHNNKNGAAAANATQPSLNQNFSDASFNTSTTNGIDETTAKRDRLEEESKYQDNNENHAEETSDAAATTTSSILPVAAVQRCDRTTINNHHSERQMDVASSSSFVSPVISPPSITQSQMAVASSFSSAEVYNGNTSSKGIEFNCSVLDIPDIKSIEEEAATYHYAAEHRMKQNECDLPVLDLELENIINGSFNGDDEYKRKVESTTNEIIKVVFENGELINNESCNMITSVAGSLPLPGFNQAFGSTEIGRYLQQKDFIQHAAFIPPSQPVEPSLFTFPQQHHQQFQMKQFAQQHQQQHAMFSPYNNNNNAGMNPTMPSSSPMSMVPPTLGIGPTGGTVGKTKSTRGGKRGSKTAANATDISKHSSGNVWINPYEHPDLPSSSGMSTSTYYTSGGAGGGRKKESRRGKSYGGTSSSSVASAANIDNPQYSVSSWNCYRGGQPNPECCSGLYSAHGGCQFSPTSADMASGGSVCDYYTARESHANCSLPPPYASTLKSSAYYSNPTSAESGANSSASMMEQPFNQQQQQQQRLSSPCYSQNWRNDRYYPYGDYSSYQCGRQQTYGASSSSSSNGLYQNCLHPHMQQNSHPQSVVTALQPPSQQQQQQSSLPSYNNYPYNHHQYVAPPHHSYNNVGNNANDNNNYY